MRKYPLHGAGYIYLLHMVQTFSSVPHWARRQDGTEYILCSDINVWASLLWLLLSGWWELRWIFSVSTGDAADSIGLVICMVETMVTNWGYVSGTPLPRRIIYLCHRGFSSGFHFLVLFIYQCDFLEIFQCIYYVSINLSGIFHVFTLESLGIPVGTPRSLLVGLVQCSELGFGIIGRVWE